MENAMAIGQHPGDNNNVLMNMSAELQDILARVEVVLNKSSDLTEQISIRENRQRYLDEALEESRKLAAAISHDAEERIQAVEARTQRIVAPQKAQIAELEMRIAELRRETGADLTIPDLETALIESIPEPQVFSPAHIVSMPIHIEPVKSIYVPEMQMETAFSVDGTAALDVIAAVFAVPAVEEELNPDLPEPVQILEQSQDEETGLEPPTDLALDGSADNIGSKPVTAKDEIGSTTEIMCLETDITIQHHSSTKSWHRKKHSHHWHLQVQVEVPEAAVHAIHSHVLNTITSTLAPYGDVLLNDVFPFDFIEPKDDKVAGYFFNILEDNLIMKDLILKELAISEDESVIAQLSGRNSELDEMLKGEDVIQQMRINLLTKSIPAEQPAQKRFGFFRKN